MRLRITAISFGLTVLGFTALSVVAPKAQAQVMTHQQLKIDDTLVHADQAFSVPTGVVVVPIFPPSSDFREKDIDWFRGLYYFLTANENRPGFTDIPFHYLVSKDGRIFTGNTGGEERKINISGLGDQYVVIGYLAGRSDNTFDVQAEEILAELILDVANRNSINLANTTITAVRYVRDDENKTVSLEKQELFGLWRGSMTRLVDSVKGRYAPTPKTYTATITNVTLPTEAVNPGDSVVGQITIKNTGQYGMYQDSISELLGSRVGGSSKFYLPEYWPSTSQFTLMPAGAILLPGEEKQFEFTLYIPLFWGAVTETFELCTVQGQVIASTQFPVTLNVNRPAGTIVEVKPNSAGWVAVRSQPYREAGEIARISTGDRFFQLEVYGMGWVKIKLHDGREGWTSQYSLNYL
jgi:hypothetical protein